MRTAEGNSRVRRSRLPRHPRRVLLLLGSYYRANHDGIVRYAKEHHWSLDLSYIRVGQLKYTLRLDGIIGLITTPRDLEALRRLPRNIPLVDISAAWGTEALPDRTGARVPRVLYDTAAAGRIAARHFIERGFRHIAFFNQGNYWMERERRVTFKAAVEKAGLAFHELEHYRWMAEDHGATQGQANRVLQRLEKELGLLTKPVGVFCPSDDSAALLFHACEEAGLHAPEEVAILGCHNEPYVCDFAPIPLSSLDDNLEQLGYEAARLLDRLMDGKSPPRAPILVPPKGVVTRTSTDILAVDRVEVARALRYIWEHYTEPIQTGDVARALRLSRRNLVRLFQQVLGRGIGAEIARKRIERAKELLEKSGMKAWQVAEQSGFSSAEHLSKAFTRIVGEPPSVYRARRIQTASRKT